MFTGIVEEKGKVRYIQLTGESGILAVKARKVLEGTRIGDSIAVNGVCLTVTSIQPDGFTADVMAETIRRSSLGSCKAGRRHNLVADFMTANNNFFPFLNPNLTDCNIKHRISSVHQPFYHIKKKINSTEP